MRIGILKLEVYLRGMRSLKEKRGVVRSLIKRIGNQFNVSVAEVDNLDNWQKSTWGLSAVSNDAGHIHQILQNVLDFIDRDGRVEVIDYKIEIL